MLPCLLRKLPRRRPTRQFRDSQKVLIKNRADKGFLCTYPVKFNLAFQIVFKIFAGTLEHSKQVARKECKKVPRQACRQVPKQVAKQECKNVPKQECRNVPKEVCDILLANNIKYAFFRL